MSKSTVRPSTALNGPNLISALYWDRLRPGLAQEPCFGLCCEFSSLIDPRLNLNQTGLTDSDQFQNDSDLSLLLSKLDLTKNKLDWFSMIPD